MSIVVGRTGSEIARRLNAAGLSNVNRAARSLLRLLTGNRLRIKVDGLILEGPVEASRILSQLKAGSFEPFEIELFSKSLDQGMRAVDIGANIGYYTLIASRRVGSHGVVFAFEPDSRNLRALRNNVRFNEARNVTVIEKAISDKSESRAFYVSTHATLSALHRTMDDEPRTVEVDAVSLDDLHLGPIDVIKMDIQGGEAAALRGMVQTLTNSPGVCVFLEFSPSVLRDSGEDPVEFARELRDRFREVLVIDTASRRLVPFKDPGERLLNLLCR